jgi:hypothetical protein
MAIDDWRGHPLVRLELSDMTDASRVPGEREAFAFGAHGFIKSSFTCDWMPMPKSGRLWFP